MTYDEVLIEYGKAMKASQKLEGRIVVLAQILNVSVESAKWKRPSTDDEFQRLLRKGENATFGTALRNAIKQTPERGVTQVPAVVDQTLSQAKDVRNFLAHRYFHARGELLADVNAYPALVAELRWFTEIMDALGPAIDRWTNVVLGKLGFTTQQIVEEQRRSFSILDRMAAEFRTENLSKFEDYLRSKGVCIARH